MRLIDNKLTFNITYMILIKLIIEDHVKNLWCFIIALKQFDIILKMSWLKQHDFYISFKKKIITLNFDHCISHYLLYNKFITIHNDKKNQEISYSKNLF